MNVAGDVQFDQFLVQRVPEPIAERWRLDAAALTRLCFVFAVATLYLGAQGPQVVAAQKRRWVDPHWLRGNSYLRIGWQWVKTALARDWELLATLHVSGAPDPEPCRASASQPTAPLAVTFTQTICYPPS